MGKTKQLLPFGDSTIIEQVVGNILESKVDETIVVLGHQARRIASQIAGKPLKVVLNQDYHQGVSSSIKCGLNHASKISDAIMIFLGDQPLIGREVINRLVDEFVRGSHGIVAPVYNRKRGHPVIFAAKYRAELARLEGDIGARGVIEAHPEDVLEVEASSASIITDIDNESDYRSQQNNPSQLQAS